MNTTTHPKHRYLVTDFETGPLPESELVVPEFEPAANLVDPKKKEASIANQKASWMEKLALSPLTGHICAIGIIDEDGQEHTWDTTQLSESAIIRHVIETYFSTPRTIVTWNGNKFDWGFLFRRCWRHGIKPPAWMRDGRYWNRYLVDVRELFHFYEKDPKGKLGEVMRFLGVGEKSGDGSQFYQLLQTNPKAAREYLVNDIRGTAAVYERIKQDF